VLLARYGPPGVLVDDNLDIIHFRGDTSAYLEHPHGEASLNLIRMLPPGTLIDVRRALQEARAKDAPARSPLRVRRGRGVARGATVEVIPIQGPRAGKGRCFLILFEDEPSPRPRAESPPHSATETARDGRVADLEDELATTRVYQQTLLEEQEAANEELQSANEEVLSSNEELQSINEELETAKEELQSANEELTTVNEELQNRNQELSHATDDMFNLLASLNIPIVMLGADLRLRRFTPAAARFYNLIPGDVGRPLGDLRGTLDVTNLDETIREAIDSVRVKTEEVADHEGHWYSLRVHPYKTKDNRIDGAVLLLIDIDELKRGTDRLERARNYAEAIVDNVRHPVLILDARMRVERANRTFYETFQTRAEETEGRSFFDLGAREWNVPELRRGLEQMPPRGDTDPVTIDAEFAGLGRRTMTVTAHGLAVGEPETTRILISIDDRTAETRTLRERESRILREESAARQAETANRLKDEFIATVSHELRGPLNAMAGWVHVLGTAGLDEDMKARGLAALERSVKAQARLIEDLLDMSRIMAGKLHLAHRFVRLGDVVRAAAEAVSTSAEAKSVSVHVEMANDPALVLGDPDRLQQVVWNLLTNAVKFTPRDGRVVVRVRRRDTSTELEISDTGQGIPADFLPYMFEPFRQADTSPSRTHQGLGLGLAITRHLVEAHGGLIRAESGGPNHGTTMTVCLPVPALSSQAEDEGAAERGTAGGRGQPDRALLAGVRVLVVEDEADSREILAAVLRESGAEVTVADSALVALGVVERSPPHVLVSDIGMPDMDGFDLIRALRRRAPDEVGRIPAIALTAYAEGDSRKKVLDAGFDEHLSKPADPQDLIAAVARRAGRDSAASR